MQVCRNGHVVTDLLHTYPERSLSHCDRCGAATLDRCPTCGWELPGAVRVPGLIPVGLLEPPRYCPACGAAFPWAADAESPGPEAWSVLENLLRRLPRVARQLRERHGDRPPFRITDERDLEDLVRALLPLHFDDVLPRRRTPAYAPGTVTDFLLQPENIVVTAKYLRSNFSERQLGEQLEVDIVHYAREQPGAMLACLVYEPELTLLEPRRLETMWSQPREGLTVRCVIAG
jgi:hypothetical protein